MTIEIIKPENREAWLKVRTQDVTASAAAALLGIHPYSSALDLWAEKTGRKQVVLDEDDPVLRRGRILEYAAIDMIREDFPAWEVTHSFNNRYFRDPELRMGATPDAFAKIPAQPGRIVIQIKTASDYSIKAWRDPETKEITPPLWVAVQASIEAELTKAQGAKVALLHVGHGIALHMVDIPLHAPLMDRIKGEVRDFWRLIAEKRIPDPDYGKDSELIEELYAVSGKVVDLTKDNEVLELIDRKASLAETKTAIEKEQKEIKSKLLVKMGIKPDEVAKAGETDIGKTADGRIITVKQTFRGAYEVKPTTFKDLRVKKAGA